MATEQERQSYVDEMAQTRGYVLDYHKVMAKHDYEVLKAGNRLIENVYLSQRLLDRRTKELIFITSLTAMHASRGHIAAHMKLALDFGVPAQAILEALEILFPEAGVVTFQAGLDVWREVVGADGLEPTVSAIDAGSGGLG